MQWGFANVSCLQFGTEVHVSLCKHFTYSAYTFVHIYYIRYGIEPLYTPRSESVPTEKQTPPPNIQRNKKIRDGKQDSRSPPNEDKSSAVFHVPWVSYPSIILSRSRKSSSSPVPLLLYTTITPSPMSSCLVDLDTIPRVIRARPLMFQRHDGAVDAFNVRPRFGPCFRDGVHGGFDAGGAAGFGIGGGCGCRLPTVSCEQGRERDGIGGERTNQCRCLCVVVL
jgi:hypothetical protein